ncbi:MAG: ArsR family transcriptional regulator [Candidatus Eisenbacteria bacterium]
MRPEREKQCSADQARLEVCHIIGRLMELWGFRKNLGRIWTLLYLEDEPLCAAEIAGQLSISRGSASMALQELLRWGVVRKSWKPGERKDFFEAEQNVPKLVLRVLNERELPAINEAIGGLKEVLQALEEGAPAINEAALSRRTRDLLDITERGRSLFIGFLGPEGGGAPLWDVLSGGAEERR